MAGSWGWVVAVCRLAVGGGEYEIEGERCRLPKVQITTLEEVQLPAREAGVLAQLEVREGMYVEPDQELGRIDDAQARLHVRHAEREYDAARRKATSDVDLKFARKTLDVGAAELFHAEDANRRVSGTVTATELRRLRLAVDKADLQIEQAERDRLLAEDALGVKQVAVELAQDRLARHGLRSPLRGVVVELLKRRGEWVNPGDPVVRILRTDRLRVQGFLNVRDFGPELLGRPVSVAVEFPGGRREEFPGKVLFVSPEVEPVTGDFRFWAEVENRGLLLRPGLTGAMTILLTGQPAADAPKADASRADAPPVGAAQSVAPNAVAVPAGRPLSPAVPAARPNVVPGAAELPFPNAGPTGPALRSIPPEMLRPVPAEAARLPVRKD